MENGGGSGSQDRMDKRGTGGLEKDSAFAGSRANSVLQDWKRDGNCCFYLPFVSFFFFSLLPFMYVSLKSEVRAAQKKSPGGWETRLTKEERGL